jgi:hypothetical protein
MDIFVAFDHLVTLSITGREEHCRNQTPFRKLKTPSRNKRPLQRVVVENIIILEEWSGNTERRSRTGMNKPAVHIQTLLPRKP